MGKMIKKFCSLLSADASNYGKIIKDVESRGFYGIHFDVMDGHFVNNFAFNAKIISSLRKLTKMVFEAHLEIENPEQYLDMFINAGSDMITIHPQTTKNPESTLRYLRAKNITSSVAIDPDIKTEKITGLFPLIDNIIIMSVYPGFGEQEFIESSYEKIRRIRKLIDDGGFEISIAVDGCVNNETEEKIIDCGADILIYGSSLFRG
jgi:ribulose-phosphate 3-epimerase